MKTLYLILLLTGIAITSSAQTATGNQDQPDLYVKTVPMPSAVSISHTRSRDHFTVVLLQKCKKGKVVLYNSKGRKVRKQAIADKVNDISLQGLDEGKYKVKVLLDKEVRMTGYVIVT